MKKRALSLLMAFVMVIGLLPATVRAADSGDTVTGDISVSSAAELAALGGKDIDGNITLTANIDMSNTEMTPIKSLTGTFNGQGHVISDLTLTGQAGGSSRDKKYTALISTLNSGTVKNLKLDKITVSANTSTADNNHLSTLIAYVNAGNCTIENCVVTGNVTYTAQGTEKYPSTNYVSGLVGEVFGYYNNPAKLQIVNCTVDVAVTGAKKDYAAGLVATSGAVSGTVENCAVLGNVTADKSEGYAGGLLGSTGTTTKFTFANCYYAGKVSGSTARTMALMTPSKRNAGTLTYGDNCYYLKNAKQEIDAKDYVGTTVTGTPTAVESIDGIRALEFADFVKNEDGYPVPEWTPAAPPAPQFSCTLVFENTQGGTLVVKHGDQILTPNSDGQYMINKTGDDYSYTVIFGEGAEYENVYIPAFSIYDSDNGTTKTITVNPKRVFSCALTFTGTKTGTLTVKDSEGKTLTATDGVYTLSAAGDYSYSVTFGEDSPYNNVAETPFTVGENDTEKAIAVTLTYKTAKPEGNGKEESPILIGTAAELRYFAEQVNNGKLSDAYVKLEKDITVPGSWTPLTFSGHFDGDGHSVTITVDDPSLRYFGFFGCLDSKIDRDSTTSIDDQPTVVVENLTVNGTVYCSEPYAHVGGIAGCARGKVEIKNCVNNATVSSLARGSAGVGGLVGGYDDGVEYVYKNIRMTVDGCTNNGTIIVTGTDTDAKVGGLVGANKNCVQVSKSNNTGTINAPGCTVGGLLGEAGYQTGDFKPAIQDSSNTGILIGAEGKTNNLYGKGPIRSGYLINSGSNTYTGGSESEDELLKESRKYNDVLAVPATAEKDYEITLLKSGEAADKGITVTCSVGERDTNKDYLKVVDGKLQLAKKNDTGKVIEATATITWSKGDQTLSKPVTVNIYPAAVDGISARKTLMDKIAATYTNSSSDWVVFDMAAYAKLDGAAVKTSDTARENYLNLTINELAGNTPLVTDRAKAEIILAALGIDSTRLTPLDGAEYSNAAKLAAMNLGTSHYTAPWVLLAEQAGQVKLTDAQRANMISLLTDSANLGKDGLFFTKWAGETFADPDTTGTALAALAKYNTADYPAVQAFITKAVAGLSAAQRDNGSYGNVNSDAMVIIGLTAIGIDPASDERFVKGGCSLADALLLYVNDDQKGFTTSYISGTQGENAQALATEQGFRALVALEKFESLSSDPKSFKSFNIYTQTTKTSQSGNTTVITPNKPNKGFTSDGAGTVPSTSTDSGTGGSAGSTTTAEWISVAVSIEPGSGSAWYSGSVRVAEGATVEQALETAAAQAGLILNIKDGYLRAVIRSGVTLGQYNEGPNSGWLYKVNGKAPNVGIADYRLNGGETVTVYYTADYTKESGLDISAPASGGAVGKTETVTNADGSTTKTETKPDGTTVATTTKPDGSTTVAETKPDGSVSTVEKRADGTEIKTAQSASGGITASVSVPKSVGSTRVDIPVSKPTGSMVAVIVHPDGTEEIVKGSVVTETGIALRAEGNVRLKIIDNAKRFNDMADHWAKDAVEFASSRELFNGVGNDAFGPDRSMTRGMVNTVLARLAGADTAGGETWYAKGTAWAVENGISDGTNPEQQVTREQLAAMLYRYAGSPAVSGELSFDDTTVISIWAYDAVRWCVDNGILNGVGGNRMTPQDLARRGQVAAMLMRFLQATV